MANTETRDTRDYISQPSTSNPDAHAQRLLNALIEHAEHDHCTGIDAGFEDAQEGSHCGKASKVVRCGMAHEYPTPDYHCTGDNLANGVTLEQEIGRVFPNEIPEIEE